MARAGGESVPPAVPGRCVSAALLGVWIDGAGGGSWD